MSYIPPITEMIVVTTIAIIATIVSEFKLYSCDIITSHTQRNENMSDKSQKGRECYSV